MSGLYQINDDWSVLVAQAYQNMEADGESVEYPVGSDGQQLQALQGTFFVPVYDKDKFENTSLTIDGKIGDLKAVYAGSYLVRNIDQTNDYTNYARSFEGFYYSCAGGVGNGSGFGNPGVGAPAGSNGTTPVCYSPVTSWRDQVRNAHLSNEFRLSTPDDWRLRGIVGVYDENFQIADDQNFKYKTIPSCTAANLATALAGGPVCVANVGPIPGSMDTDPNVRDDNTAYGQDVHRGYHQLAGFASIDFDLIPKVLTLTGGTRYYHYNEYENGTLYQTNDGCVNVPNGQCSEGGVATVYGGGANISAYNDKKTYSGFKSRGNLTWHITDDAMVYYTFSQGFRPGGFNRKTKSVADLNAANPRIRSTSCRSITRRH